MSLQRCIHRRARLADNATCGVRCGAFPECLPVFPAELARDVARTLAAAADEFQAASAICATLDQLHAAISQGLNRKVGDVNSPSRW
jgi:hypothetical protein